LQAAQSLPKLSLENLELGGKIVALIGREFENDWGEFEKESLPSLVTSLQN